MKAVMKAGVALLACSATYAMAQSSVTLYGRLDESIEYTNLSAANGKPSKRQLGLVDDSTVFGLYGREDLGGGFAAIFRLESWFNLTNGALFVPNTLWGMQSYVGVTSKDYGTFTLGSQYTPAAWLSYAIDPFGRTGIGDITNLTQINPAYARGYNATHSSSMAYSYTSQATGLTGRLMYAPSGRADAPTDLGTYLSAGVDFRKGGFFAGATYEDSKIAGKTVGSGQATLGSKTSSFGLAYDFKFATISALYSHNTIPTQPTVNAYFVGLTVPINPANFILASAALSNQSNTEGGRANTFALEYKYLLSKRTFVYVSAGRMNNGNQTSFGMWPAELNYTVSPGQHITTVHLGIHHNF